MQGTTGVRAGETYYTDFPDARGKMSGAVGSQQILPSGFAHSDALTV
jgi:hypothetical protein